MTDEPTMFDQPMTPGERRELATVVRLRSRVAKADLEARKAALLADFEEQVATEYEFDDARWAMVTAAAKQAVADADQALEHAYEEAGIPTEFRPELHLSWYKRGRGASTSRQQELRRVAETRLTAQVKQAKVEVDRAEAHLLGDLAARGLSTGEAKGWLDRLPTVEALLPRLVLTEMNVSVQTEHRSRYVLDGLAELEP